MTSRAPATVLVVDDDRDMVELIVNVLSIQGRYRTLSAFSGEEALKLIGNELPDLILLDVMMPQLDGFEVLRTLKRNPKTRETRVIMLTVIDQVKAKLKAFSLGASDYLVKPFDEDELVARVEKHLKMVMGKRALVLAKELLEDRVRERTSELMETNEDLQKEIVVRQHAEEALRESEEIYRNLVERANDGILIIQDGFIKYANPRAGEMNQYEVDELVDTSLFDYILPEEAPKVIDYYRGRLGGEDVEQVYETVFVRKDGSELNVEINAGMTLFQGKPSELVIIRDITERKKAEETLRESEERYRELFENAHDIIQSVSPDDGSFIYVNKAWMRALGYERHELSGMTLFDILHPDSRPRYKDMTEKILAGDSFTDVPTELLDKDGGPIMVEGNITPRFIDGKLAEIQCFFRDISERKQAEERLQIEEEKRMNVVINTTHLLHTPLTIVKGNLELVRKGQKDMTPEMLDKLVGRLQEMYKLIMGELTDNIELMTVKTSDGFTPAEKERRDTNE